MYKDIIQHKSTPQTEPIRGKTMIQNNAGGYGFEKPIWDQLNNFLLMGTYGGTYYVNQNKLTRDNVGVLDQCLREDPARAIRRIVAISVNGQAPKVDHAIFALAFAAASPDQTTRHLALTELNKVCRTGAHLFQFVSESLHGELRGSGRAFRRALTNWYTSKTPQQIAFQALKYQKRGRVGHKEVIRLAHPKTANAAHNALLKFIVSNEATTARQYEGCEPLVAAVQETLNPTTKKQRVVQLIREFEMGHEMVHTKWRTDVDVLTALAEVMPIGATLRNLGALTAHKALTPLSELTKTVCERLASAKRLKNGRVHPIGVFTSLATYAKGRGRAGSLAWTPIGAIKDALNDAFYTAFAAVEPNGKRHCLGIDVSGSMSYSHVAGMEGTPASSFAAIMAMVQDKVESNTYITVFSTKVLPVALPTHKAPLHEIRHLFAGMPFGGTDCSAHIRHCRENRIPVDVFVTYSDSESWAGTRHACEELRRYRDTMGINAKSINIDMVPIPYGLADPDDPRMINIGGFNTTMPTLISAFGAI